MTPPIVAAVRRFVEDEVRPVADALEHADAYPHALVARMRALGLFGALVPADYGGLGIAVNQGSAAEKLGLAIDVPVRIEDGRR